MNPKLPPHNVDAEMSVLGSVFIDNECLSKVKTIIAADDFYPEKHRLLFDLFCRLHSEKSPIDFVTVTSALNGDIKAAGGVEYLAELTDFTPTSANVSHYCKLVKDCAMRRRLIRRAQDVVAGAYDLNTPISDTLTDAKEAIIGAYGESALASESDLLTLENRAERYIKYVKSVGTMRFRTGFGDIDNHIRGVAPGEVMTIIAYSGTFKSALLQNLLHGNAERTGLRQIFFSLEMPVEKVFEREVQMMCGMSGNEVEREYRDALWKDRHATMLKRGSDKVLVCEKSKLSISKISGYVELARHKYGQIGGIGIDYLGLMHAEGKSIFDKMAALSADIKGLAKELQIPVVLLCQVNRGYANSKGNEIEMDAAKGGGDIEAGADFMLGMWAKEERVFAKLLKNRNGSANHRWEMDIDRETLQFVGTMDYVEPISEETSKAYGRGRTTDLPNF